MIAEASNRTPFAAIPAQPGSESAPPTHASARSAARRDARRKLLPELGKRSNWNPALQRASPWRPTPALCES
jgi:hypothetical protein